MSALPPPSVLALEAARWRLADVLDGEEGIIGSAIGAGNHGLAIVVYARGGASDKVPCDFEGFEVCTVIVSEDFNADDVTGR